MKVLQPIYLKLQPCKLSMAASALFKVEDPYNLNSLWSCRALASMVPNGGDNR